MAQLVINVADQPSPSTSRQKQARLTREGSAFLINYARTVNSYPQKAEKEAILSRLREIPGNQSCTLERLNNWFARHRTPRAGAATTTSPAAPHAVLVDDETILFPKLTPTHFQQLRVLYKKRTHPSEDIITFWTNRINADREEVAAWIQYQQVKEKASGVDTAPESPDVPVQQLMTDPINDGGSVSPIVPDYPRPHLPTPSKSQSLSPHARSQSLPSIAVKVEESHRNSSTLWTHPIVRSPVDDLPPRLQQMPGLQAKAPLSAISHSPALPYVGGRPSNQDLNASLVAAIRDSLGSEAAIQTEPPRTVDEFAEQFKNVKMMIDTFMQKYDTGQLVQFGWDPCVNKVAP